ncbi:MAG: YciI family protein [Thermomicrobiales bacterium]
MHYLCLVFRQDTDPRERETQVETAALVEALVDNGYDIAAFPLAPCETATTLRRTGDGLVLSDGPITAGPACLQSVYVIGARDLNDAVRLAAWLPEARSAEVEIRPITALPQQPADPPGEAPSQEITVPVDSPASASGLEFTPHATRSSS